MIIIHKTKKKHQENFNQTASDRLLKYNFFVSFLYFFMNFLMLGLSIISKWICFDTKITNRSMVSKLSLNSKEWHKDFHSMAAV